jgi:hypothetical protein
MLFYNALSWRPKIGQTDEPGEKQGKNPHAPKLPTNLSTETVDGILLVILVVRLQQHHRIDRRTGHRIER